MVGRDGVGDVFHEDGLAGLRLCDDECALSLADGGEEVDDACRDIVVHSTAEVELLVGEEGCQVLEGDAVAHHGGVFTVDFRHFDQREVFFAFLGRADDAFDDVACLQAEELDLRL